MGARIITLPLWADNDEARTLLAAIRIERPDAWYRARFEGDSYATPRFKGMNARSLREMWQAARDAAMDANDRERWAALGEEGADQLIAHHLAQPDVPFVRMSIELTEDGGRIAA
jgi:hypothetical protein